MPLSGASRGCVHTRRWFAVAFLGMALSALGACRWWSPPGPDDGTVVVDDGGGNPVPPVLVPGVYEVLRTRPPLMNQELVGYISSHDAEPGITWWLLKQSVAWPLVVDVGEKYEIRVHMDGGMPEEPLTGAQLYAQYAPSISPSILREVHENVASVQTHP